MNNLSIMKNASRGFLALTVFLAFFVFASSAYAACPAYPQVSWWGKLTHEGVVGYVSQKHAGDWSGYLDKWQRQLAKIRLLHSQKKGIKIPSTGTVVKGQELSDYIGKLAQRVKINQCLSKDKKLNAEIAKKVKKTANKAATPYGAGVNAYKAGNFKAAHDLWLPVANKGNPKAQNALGHLFRKGLGVEANIETSRQWYAKSAAQGDPVGLFSLADIARESAKSKEEKINVIKMMMKSALKNYGAAQFALAEINFNGEGVRVNPVEAYFWSSLATKNKYRKAKPLFERLQETVSAENKQAQDKRVEKWLAKYK